MSPEIFGIDSYTLMCAIGLIAAVAFLIVRRGRLEINRIIFTSLIVSAVVGMIIGSKIVFYLTQLPVMVKSHVAAETYIREFIEAGYVFYGGVLGAFAGLLVCCRMTRTTVHPVLNFFTPAFAFFHGFGRIGCFLAGCCYGIEVESFGFVMADGVRKFPVQLVESVFEFCMFFALLRIETLMLQKKKSPKLSFYYLMFYSFVRFLLEFVRGDEERGIFGPFSTSQWIALVILVIGLIVKLLPRVNARKYPKCPPSKP
ncbi:MAG: prolipoprotein diacylglyceryl transferase [Lachnospiraceae bacterium]|nr:prolipoprotein diacylglyceryl transferase [Lachnospiraceae bacterium]